jgi:hypothetical protein
MRYLLNLVGLNPYSSMTLRAKLLQKLAVSFPFLENKKDEDSNSWRKRVMIPSVTALLLAFSLSLLFFGDNTERGHGTEEWLHEVKETVRADLLYVNPQHHKRHGVSYGASEGGH